MGVAPFPVQPASQLGPLGTNTNVTLTAGAEIPNPDAVLTQREYVLNTYSNENAINTGRMTDVVDLLRAFGEGSPTVVTYYHRIDGGGNIRGTDLAIDDDLNRVHAAYLKIHDFELRITSSLQFDHLTDDALNSLVGDAVTYPGFEPKVGDRFIMELDTGRFGFLEINEQPKRLAVRSMSYWSIRFILTDWLDDTFLATVEAGVRQEGWFDKNRFLTEPGALLIKEEVILMTKAKVAVAQMTNYFTEKFFDRLTYGTYMRPDKVFDPYVVDFLRQILDYSETRGLPEQFVPDATCIKTSWWAWLLNADVVPVEAIPAGWKVRYYRIGSQSTQINALVNKPYLLMIGPGDTSEWGSVEDYYRYTSTYTHVCMYPDRFPPNNYYPEPEVGATEDAVSYKEQFILAGTTEASAFYKVVTRFSQDRVIVPTDIMTAFTEVYSASSESQFYQFPVLIFLAKLIINRLHGLSGASRSFI